MFAKRQCVTDGEPLLIQTPWRNPLASKPNKLESGIRRYSLNKPNK